MLSNSCYDLHFVNTYFIQSSFSLLPPFNLAVLAYLEPKSSDFLTSITHLFTNMSQRLLDNMLMLGTLPDLYAYSYHKAREATSSLCFRTARAHARAPHHLRLSGDGHEPPGLRAKYPTDEGGDRHPLRSQI